MDSANNRDKSTSHLQEKGWNDPTLNWDDMKDGIFEKILEEDPAYFDKKRKRRIPGWIFFFGVIFISSTIGYLFKNKEIISRPVQPTIQGSPEAKKKTPVIAANPKQTIEEEVNNIDTEIFFSNNKIKNTTTTTTTTTNSLNHIQKQKNESPINRSKLFYTQAKEEHENIIVTEKTAINKTQPSPIIYAPIIPLEIKIQSPRLNISTIYSTKNTALRQESKNFKWKIAATGGPVYSSSKYTGNSLAVEMRNENSSPYFGYQLGIDSWIPLKKNNFLSIGIAHQTLFQNIDIYTERQVDTFIQNVLIEVTHYRVGGRSENAFGDTTLQAVEKNWLVNYNEFKTVQLKTGYGKVFNYKKWRISPFAGLLTGWHTNMTGKTVAEDKSIFAFDKKNSILNKFQLQSFIGVEMERSLSNKTSLSFRYRFDKQWNNASTESYMKLKPVLHIFSIGVSTIIE